MIDTPFTRSFGLKHAIALAPEPGLASASLAAAVTEAGGLGLIGCGGQSADWIAAEYARAGETAVGCGVSCQALDDDPRRVQAVLNGRPLAVYLHDGDPRAHAEKLRAARVRVICEVKTLADAERAVAAEAEVIVARGTDAAGQPAPRTMFNLVPELADLIRREADDMILLAFGGVVDARTLSAVIALGADGAVMSSRLLASEEGRKTASPPSSQGAGMVRDVLPVASILDQVTRRAERVLSHSMRAVIE
ncbi:MAG: nitronate monooxygenase [Pseudomonadota bacterium]